MLQKKESTSSMASNVKSQLSKVDLKNQLDRFEIYE